MSKVKKSVVLDSKTSKNKKNFLSSLISFVVNLISFTLIIAIVSVYLMSNPDQTHSFFGYSIYLVLTDSMHSEIPQESFVLVKSIDPNTIQIDDDITFLNSDKKTITHKVVDIFEDYMQSGMRGFKTKGVDNTSTDREIVYADNVIGLVTFHSAGMGMFLTWLKSRIWFAIALTVVLMALVAILDYLRKKKKEDNSFANTLQPEESETQTIPTIKSTK